MLHGLPFATACAVAYACACTCRELWLADLVPAERNLGLAAALAVRALPGLRPWGSASAVGRDWLAHGGLEGCLYGAGLRCLSRRTLLGGAALFGGENPTLLLVALWVVAGITREKTGGKRRNGACHPGEKRV